MRTLLAALAPAALAPVALALVAAPAAAQEDTAEARIGAAFEGLSRCHVPLSQEGAHEMHVVSAPVSWSDEPGTWTIGLMTCALGAYNVVNAVIVDDGFEAGLAAFAAPLIEAEEEGDAVTALRLAGFGASTLLVNAVVDPATGAVTEGARLRGLGDASTFGRWELRDGAYALVRYEADLSYDGEINPWLVVEDGLPVEPAPLPAGR